MAAVGSYLLLLTVIFICRVTISSKKCSFNAGIIIKDRKQPTSILAYITTDNPRKCAKFCLMRSKCRSFNYNKNATSRQCEINEFDINNSTILYEEGYLVSRIATWDQGMVGSCSARQCGPDQMCVEDSSEYYICIPLDIRCGVLEFIMNTNLKLSNEDAYNSTAEFTCKRGYRNVKGTYKSTCQLNSTWSPVNIKCELVDCRPPKRINSTIMTSYKGTKYGSKVIYSCINGTVHRGGNGTSVCLQNGTWSKATIKCGTCGTNKQILKQNNKWRCCKKSTFPSSYIKNKNTDYVIANEPSTRQFLKQEAINKTIKVWAGFKLEGVMLVFINADRFRTDSNQFEVGNCTKTCGYNKRGELTDLSEAFFYTFAD